jgi:hypothetical protein
MPNRIRSLLVVGAVIGTISAAVAWQAPPQDDPKDLLPVLRRPPPKFWKGNLHTHSFWSDGDDFPEMIADWYQRHGYHFLALSDHNILAEGDKWIDVKAGKGDRTLALKKYRARFGDAWVDRRQVSGAEQVRLKPLAEYRSLLEQPGRFLMMPAEEITHRFALKPVHVNAINLRDVILPTSAEGVAETIRVNVRAVHDQRKRAGRAMLAFLNHPNFYWSTRAEEMLVEELLFFEVFNGHSSVRNYGDAVHPGTEKLWDIALALRLGKFKMPLLYGLGTDDAHAYHIWGLGKTNPGRGWIMVRAPHLSAEAIIKAIEAGDFYASSGGSPRGGHLAAHNSWRAGGDLQDPVRGDAAGHTARLRAAQGRDGPRHGRDADLPSRRGQGHGGDGRPGADVSVDGSGAVCAGAGDVVEAASEPV